MPQLVKTKRQANFKGFKRFGAFKGLVEQKNVFNSFVCKLGLFWHSWAFKTLINYYFLICCFNKAVNAFVLNALIVY
jgi:hypothetical protein